MQIENSAKKLSFDIANGYVKLPISQNDPSHPVIRMVNKIGSIPHEAQAAWSKKKRDPNSALALILHEGP